MITTLGASLGADGSGGHQGCESRYVLPIDPLKGGSLCGMLPPYDMRCVLAAPRLAHSHPRWAGITGTACCCACVASGGRVATVPVNPCKGGRGKTRTH